MIFTSSAMVCTLLLGLGVVRQEVAEQFAEKSLEYTGGSYESREFNYRLLVPATRHEHLPLVVWLHGYGENGSDNTAQLEWLDLLVKPEQEAKHLFYILAVQCPADNPTWYQAHDDGQYTRRSSDDMCEVAMAALREVVEEYPVDENRIYLAGVSSGGSGCWEFAMRYPEVFAAVAPMSSSDIGTQLEALLKMPIWAFHVRADPVSPEPVRRAVAALRSQGGPSQLTELPHQGHDSWTVAFNEYHLTDWLMSQRRGFVRQLWLLWVKLWPSLAVVSLAVTVAWISRRHLRLQRALNTSPAEAEQH